MWPDWRAILGPVLTAAVSLLAIAAEQSIGGMPSPAPLQVCIVAMAAALSGVGSAAVSAVIAVAMTAVFVVVRSGGPVFDTADLAPLALLAVAAARLSAALDQIDIGVVLLDADTRAEFINRAFRRYFALSDAKADSKPPFIALMYHGRDAGKYELPEDELQHFIAERIKLMRAGDSTPINIKLTDGQVMRFSCTALPDGGRMLSYTPVTDMIRYNDDPANADYYRALRRSGGLFPVANMSAAE